MSDNYEQAVSGVAETLVTGSAPGKPHASFVSKKDLATVVSSGVGGVVVEFPSDPGLPAITMRLPYLLPKPSDGDIVLVEQLPHQRIIIGTISY